MNFSKIQRGWFHDPPGKGAKLKHHFKIPAIAFISLFLLGSVILYWQRSADEQTVHDSVLRQGERIVALGQKYFQKMLSERFSSKNDRMASFPEETYLTDSIPFSVIVLDDEKSVVFRDVKSGDTNLLKKFTDNPFPEQYPKRSIRSFKRSYISAVQAIHSTNRIYYLVILYNLKEAVDEASLPIHHRFYTMLSIVFLLSLAGGILNYMYRKNSMRPIEEDPPTALREEGQNPKEARGGVRHINETADTKANLREINRLLEKRLQEKSEENTVLRRQLGRERDKRHEKESELNQWQHIVESSSASIVITDKRGRIEYVNPYFTQVSGYPFEEVIGLNPRVLKSGEKPASEYKELWDTISSGKTWQGEFHNKKKDGTLYWEYAYIAPVTDEQGKIQHYFAIKEDITEQKKINEARNMFAAALQSIEEVVIIADRKNRFIYVNEAFEKCYGYSNDEVLNRSTALLYSSEDLKKKGRHIFEKTWHGSWYGEVETYRKDGIKIPVRVTTAMIRTEKNKANAIIAIIYDLTREKKAQEIKQKAEMLKTVQELAGGISHEFSQPLQTLSNYLELMKKGKNAEKYIEKSARALKRVAGLVDNLRQIISLERQEYLDSAIINIKASSHSKKTNEEIRVLVVDDEPEVRETLLEIIRMAGYTCDQAKDGREALEKMQQGRFDIILSDINMPGMNGTDLFEKLEDKGYQGKFIFMTGYAVNDQVETFLEKSDGVLLKPMKADSLMKMLEITAGKIEEDSLTLASKTIPEGQTLTSI